MVAMPVAATMRLASPNCRVNRAGPSWNTVWPWLPMAVMAPVSTPLDWDELEDGKLRSDSYTVLNLRQRLEGLKQDPWARYFSSRQ